MNVCMYPSIDIWLELTLRLLDGSSQNSPRGCIMKEAID